MIALMWLRAIGFLWSLLNGIVLVVLVALYDLSIWYYVVLSFLSDSA